MGVPFGVGTGRAEPAKSPAKATEAVKILDGQPPAEHEAAYYASTRDGQPADHT